MSATLEAKNSLQTADSTHEVVTGTVGKEKWIKTNSLTQQADKIVDHARKFRSLERTRKHFKTSAGEVVFQMCLRCLDVAYGKRDGYGKPLPLYTPIDGNREEQLEALQDIQNRREQLDQIDNLIRVFGVPKGSMKKLKASRSTRTQPTSETREAA